MKCGINDRVKSIREELKLSQAAFGSRIGVTRSSISSIEKGVRNMSDQTLKSICREFNVNYSWLIEGKGEMFSDLPETIVDELAEEFNLDELSKEIVRNFIELSEEERAIFTKYIKKVFIDKKEE